MFVINMVLAGYSPRLKAYLITIYKEEAAQGIGNQGYKLKYGIKNGGVILTKSRLAPRQPSIPETNQRQTIEAFLEEHKSWKRRMRSWLDTVGFRKG